ncbi:uncharacterized protein [Rutidosis leptorrhynchoides]|uniref:uncharacterized protein n=1 Tax=Rutidosis leptorrhynchoides TaxID=125765 RepID=UPI003A993C05
MITGPACTCGNVCNCPAGEFVKEQNKVQKLMQFLMGLNDCYMSVRSNILLRGPLPDVKSAYAILSREESHRNINLKENVITKPQTSAFIAQTTNKDMKYNNSRYPPGYKRNFNNNNNYKPNQGYQSQNNFKSVSNNTTASKEASTSSSPLSFSNEQMMKLLSLINETPESSTQSNMAGLFNLVNVSNLKLTAGHPNGTQALIKSIENLKINDHITLFDVLVVPEYCDLKDLKIKGTGKQDGGLYVFDDTHDSSFTASNCVSNCYASCKLWHARLGHPSDQVLNVLKTKLSLKGDLNTEPCEICHKAKQTRLPFPLSEQKTTSLGDLVHLDLWGPFKIQSKEGFKYFLTIVDDYSRAVWIYMLKSKEDVTPTAVLNGKSPYELIFKTEPNLSYIKCFGCLCFSTVLNPSDKFSSRSVKSVLIGFSSVKKGYKLYSLEDKSVFFSRDAKFYETIFSLKMKNSVDEQNDIDLQKTNFFDKIFLSTNDTSSLYDEERPNSDGDGSSDYVHNHEHNSTVTLVDGSSDNANEHSPTATHDSEQNSHSEGNSLVLQNTNSYDNLRRSTRSKVFPKKFDNFVVDDKVKYSINRVVNYSNLNSENFCFVSNLNKSYEPKTYEQAIKDKNWIEVMNTV